MKDQAFGIVPILRQSGGMQFLLVQHKAGHWGFPKGHAESGESAIAAARREFEEETGIQEYQLLDQQAFVERYVMIKHWRMVEKTVTYFPAFVRSDRVTYQKKEIQAYAWLPFDDALKTITFHQSRRILVEVEQYLNTLKPKR